LRFRHESSNASCFFFLILQGKNNAICSSYVVLAHLLLSRCNL
jgi:hypothetical protein